MCVEQVVPRLERALKMGRQLDQLEDERVKGYTCQSIYEVIEEMLFLT